MNRSTGLVAFIDESHYERPTTGYFYTMTAAVIDFNQQESYKTLMRSLDMIARRQPDHSLHANRMAKHDQPGIDQALTAIASSSAAKLIMTVRTYRGDVRTDEDARQVCLADLSTRLSRHDPVEQVTLDSRDNLGQSGKSSFAVPGGFNTPMTGYSGPYGCRTLLGMWWPAPSPSLILATCRSWLARLRSTRRRFYRWRCVAKDRPAWNSPTWSWSC